mmetsp:Transcript_12224/g.12285  ORF Transcript_12224/g.12285 Transcript_12224/m.12285 type:complete len:82 (+) Transcript_12224:304-549(+)
MGSPFSFEKVPDGLQDFVKEKQIQVLNNVLTSAAAGVLLANFVAVVSGNFSSVILVETLKADIPLLVIVALASAFSSFSRK